MSATSSRHELDEIVAREGLNWVLTHLKDNRRLAAMAASAKGNSAKAKACANEIHAIHECQIIVKSYAAVAKRGEPG